MNDPLDQRLGLEVLGVRLAAQHDLQLAEARGHPAQPLQVVKQQRRPFIGGDPARRSDRERARVESLVGALVDQLDQMTLGPGVRLADFGRRDT